MRSSIPLFELGQVVSTKEIADSLEPIQIATMLKQHITQDTSAFCLCNDDLDLNNKAIQNGDRVLSAFQTPKGKIYIITESDRSHTTILFADEY
jgi:hypothetical protein